MDFRLLDIGMHSGAENIALDEILTSRVGRRLSLPVLRFVRFRTPVALLGYHQQVKRELRLKFCLKNKIDINRRLTGGGALFCQVSSLGWEVIFSKDMFFSKNDFDSFFYKICKAAAKAYSSLGVDARFRPRNDIEVAGRKISGTGGLVLDNGILFQGTILVKNEIDLFFKVLKIPVEKLKKHEINSLKQRLIFLEDLVESINLDILKGALLKEFREILGFKFKTDFLNRKEEKELRLRISYFQSNKWIYLKDLAHQPAWLRYVFQSDFGILRVFIWLDNLTLTIRKVLITGDFFSKPQRLIFDLEAFLVGKKVVSDTLYIDILSFLKESKGTFLNISFKEVAKTIINTIEQRYLGSDFLEHEIADLFLLGLTPREFRNYRANWLLLPYCSKKVGCVYRFVSNCGGCGNCQFKNLYELGRRLNMEIVSIQSFEHLVLLLKKIRRERGFFVGSCCEPFYTKHQREMKETRAKGILINLNSTTCYDLGRNERAYMGKFERKTEVNFELIKKVAYVLVRSSSYV